MKAPRFVVCMIACVSTIVTTGNSLHGVQPRDPNCWIAELKNCGDETPPLSPCNSRECEGTITPAGVTYRCETIGVADPPPPGYENTLWNFEEYRRPGTDEEAGNFVQDFPHEGAIWCFSTFVCGGCLGPGVTELTPCTNESPAGPQNSKVVKFGMDLPCRRVVATPGPEG